MSLVYRAHSPSTDHTGTPTTDRGEAEGHASARNQYAATDDTSPADWTVQQGVITWHKEH